MAAYDLPASLVHALARTNASALAYVGHSQGTTLAFAALASQPGLAAQARSSSDRARSQSCNQAPHGCAPLQHARV